jgi:Methyltransferase domain
MEGVEAQRTYWDEYYRRLDERGSDLDWGGRWTDPFLPLLRASGARDVLELGCGTGNDSARLARHGFRVIGTDLSAHAVAGARQKYGDLVEFRTVDMAAGLPFPESGFDCSTSTHTTTARSASARGPSCASSSPTTCSRRPVRPSASSRASISTISLPAGRSSCSNTWRLRTPAQTCRSSGCGASPRAHDGSEPPRRVVSDWQHDDP